MVICLRGRHPDRLLMSAACAVFPNWPGQLFFFMVSVYRKDAVTRNEVVGVFLSDSSVTSVSLNESPAVSLILNFD